MNVLVNLMHSSLIEHSGEKRMSRTWLSLLLLTFIFTATADSFAQGGRGQGRGGQGRGGQAGNRAEREVERTRLPGSFADQIDFRSVGPTNMGGRITGFAVYEKDSSIWWAASASGGLLKTDNNGVTFEHQFTDQRTVSIGDVEVFQGDPNIVWVGTGEANPRNSVSWGDGVYKSTDGGETWTNMGLKDTFQIGRIAIHPTNADIVYVGALGRLWGPNEERGLFKTTDGGETWEKVHYVNDQTGVIDLRMNPKNPNELIIATYERQRDGFDGNDPGKKYGEGAGIYKTTDAGKSWTKLTEGLPTNKLGRIGLDYFRKDPKFVYAIVECEKIAQIPDDYPYAGLNAENIEDGVGARISQVTNNGPADDAEIKEGDIVVEVNDKLIHDADGLLDEIRSGSAGKKIKLKIAREGETVNVTLELGQYPRNQRGGGGRGGRGGGGGRGGRGGGGNPFTGTLGGQAANLQDRQGANGHEYGGVYMSKNGGKSWTRINSLNPRPMYYSQFRVDPTDRNYMYVCGTSLYKSNDGGKTFTGDGLTDGIHVDNHAMWIDPSNPKRILLGNDGGIHMTYDRMTHWAHYNNVAICQFYHVSVDTRPDYFIYGGLQDNGSWGGPSLVRNANGSSNNDWFRVGGGDGFVTFADPNDPDQLYFESQNGGMGRIHLTTGARGSIRPQRTQGGARYRFNWKTPFILSPHNSQIHYSAGNMVFRSVQKGSNLQAISPDITNTNNGAGSAISESPVSEGVLYVGTTDGAVWMTRDGGKEWRPLYSTKEQEEEDEEEESSRRGRDRETAQPNADAPLGVELQASLPVDDSPVNGNWDGEFISDQIPNGRAAFTLNLKVGDDGQVSGMYKSRRGQGDIKEGKFESESGAISFTIENDRVSMVFNGKVADDKMAGEININGGQLKINFEAKKQAGDAAASEEASEKAKQEAAAEAEVAKARAEAEKARAVAREQAQRARAEAEKAKAMAEQAANEARAKAEAEKAAAAKQAAETAESSQQQEQEQAGQGDPISGSWEGILLSDQLPEGANNIDFVLKMDSEGNVTGTSETRQGSNDLKGKYDAGSKKLTLAADADQFTIDFSADIGADKMEGMLDINDGAFSMDFEAKRTKKPEVAEEAAEQEQSESSEQGESNQDEDEGDDEDEEDTRSSKPLSDWLPGPRWVSSVEASRFRAGRVYISMDGHRSNDDEVYVFASENYGRTWRSIKANVPTYAGSVRCIREDIENQNVLYLGCEFSAWVSIDRGKSWTRLSGLPTVAVHEFAQHEASGDLIVGTHGRGVWIGNSTLLRQMTPDTLEADAHLYEPKQLTRWRREAGRGEHGTHQFVGRNPSSDTTIYYSLGSDAEEVSLEITDLEGNQIREYDELETEEGLHGVEFDGRRQGRRSNDPRFQGRRFGGAPLDAGKYLVTLTVDGESFKQTIDVVDDPVQPEAAATQLREEYQQELLEKVVGSLSEDD